MFDDDESVISALRAGASGYLLKGAEQSEIVAAVRTVASGGAVFGPAIAARVIDLFANPPPAPPSPFPELTERELEILSRVTHGDDNHAIARRLGLSPKTVANNVSNILTKLHLTDRAQAVARARDAGLGKKT
jgi:DNA-binding NarL/FixJ family response regulator